MGGVGQKVFNDLALVQHLRLKIEAWTKLNKIKHSLKILTIDRHWGHRAHVPSRIKTIISFKLKVRLTLTLSPMWRPAEMMIVSKRLYALTLNLLVCN